MYIALQMVTGRKLFRRNFWIDIFRRTHPKFVREEFWPIPIHKGAKLFVCKPCERLYKLAVTHWIHARFFVRMNRSFRILKDKRKDHEAWSRQLSLVMVEYYLSRIKKLVSFTSIYIYFSSFSPSHKNKIQVNRWFMCKYNSCDVYINKSF